MFLLSQFTSILLSIIFILPSLGNVKYNTKHTRTVRNYQ